MGMTSGRERKESKHMKLMCKLFRLGMICILLGILFYLGVVTMICSGSMVG